MTDALKPSRSLVSMVSASLVAAVCGVVQTFLVPRLLTVQGYGHWRTFLLYAGYAGLLHFGFIDGALLGWSKAAPPQRPDRRAFVRALQFLLTEQVVLLAVVPLVLLAHGPRVLAPILVALALYTLLLNVLSIAQVYLQAHFQFGKVALTYSLPGSIFVLLLACLMLTRHVSVNWLLIGYLSAWAITVVILLVQAYRFKPYASGVSPVAADESARAGRSRWKEGVASLAMGWPIVLANTGFGLMQSADRVTVNLTRPLYDFAIYSLSQSTIYVPITLLAVVSRVAFSYFARTAHEDRVVVYRSSTRALTLVWMLLLPYYFAVEFIVTRFLPRYTPGLAAGLILLLSVLFLSLIQIVQLNTFSLQGRQREFFAGSVLAVSIAFATAWLGSRVLGTLAAVASSQVFTALLWWLGNEYYLRKHTALQARDVARTLAGFATAACALLAVQWFTKDLLVDTALYAALVLPVCAALFPDERRMLIQRIRTAGQRAVWPAREGRNWKHQGLPANRKKSRIIPEESATDEKQIAAHHPSLRREPIAEHLGIQQDSDV